MAYATLKKTDTKRFHKARHQKLKRAREVACKSGSDMILVRVLPESLE